MNAEDSEKGKLISLAKKREERNKPKVEISPAMAERNKRAAEEFMAQRAEANCKKLLEGIDSELIAITRKKANKFLASVRRDERIQASKLIDNIVRTLHPNDMISLIHGFPENAVNLPAIPNAAIALAFLSLTPKIT